MDLYLSCLTGAVIGGLILSQVFRRGFDPFAPVWLFLMGYTQVYVVQAIMYREYALRARGLEVVTATNLRALWALVWFLAVYYSGIGKRLAAKLPAAPKSWSPGLVVTVSPFLVVWGIICSGLVLRSGELSDSGNLLRQFPIVLLIAGVMLIVTGRQESAPRPMFSAAGVLIVMFYVFIWMFNGRRSHSLIGVLVGTCAWYLPRFRRPSLPVMAVTGVVCALVVSVALGWRNNPKYTHSFLGFFDYMGDFDPSLILVNLNLKDRHEKEGEINEQESKETEEYGGTLLMMATVPELSSYDYGESYLRLFSTYIPRVIWKNKPIYGREQWINAWIAGSEFHRDTNFTGPAVGILGATQLNGGAVATVIVLGVLALMVRTGYDYFRYHCDTPWAQVWWPVTYYNAWLMTVNDDPMVWFYYIYGHTTLVPMAMLWMFHKFLAPSAGGHSLEAV